MSSIRFTALATLVLACASACSDSETILEPNPPGAEDPDGEAPGDDDPPTNSAIMLVAQIYSPEAYNTYVGILPEVPEGEVDFSTFRELGNANAFSSGGYVFVEEEG